MEMTLLVNRACGRSSDAEKVREDSSVSAAGNPRCHLFFLCPTIWTDNGRRRGNSDSVTGTGIGYRLGLGLGFRVRVRASVTATGMVVARASKLTCMMPESLCVKGAVDEAVASVAGTTSESP